MEAIQPWASIQQAGEEQTQLAPHFLHNTTQRMLPKEGHLPLTHQLLNCLSYTLGDVQSRTTEDGGKNMDYRKTTSFIRPHCFFPPPSFSSSFFLGKVGDWTQGLTHARQVLYQLSCSPSPLIAISSLTLSVCSSSDCMLMCAHMHTAYTQNQETESKRKLISSTDPF